MKKSTAPVLLVGTATNTPEIRYATSFVAPDAAAVIHRPEQTVLIVSSMEFGRASRQAVGCTVESPETLGLSPEHRSNVALWILAALTKYNISAVSVSSTFPLGISRSLESKGISLALDDNSCLKQARMIKSAHEIGYITHAQCAARAAMKAAEQAILEAEPSRDGTLRLNGRTLTSEVVRSIIRRTTIEFGCIDEETIVAGGKSAADPHDAGTGPLKGENGLSAIYFHVVLKPAIGET